MTTSAPDRHPKGSPASAGGRFATTRRSENDASLLLEEKLHECASARQAIADRRHAAVQRLNNAQMELHIASMEMMKDRVSEALPDGAYMLLEWGRDDHRGYSLASVNDSNNQHVWTNGDGGKAEDIVQDLGLDFTDPEDILNIPDHQIVDEGETEYIRIPLHSGPKRAR